MTTIKIRLKSGKWMRAKAHPTSHPQLFITPERERSITADLKPAKRGRFCKDQWTITHKRSGYSIIYGTYELDEVKKLAELFARAKIPWVQLRSKRDAVKYSRQHRAVMREFFNQRHP